MIAQLINRVAYAVAILVLTVTAAQAADDPLPSWSDGPARQAIVEFVGFGAGWPNAVADIQVHGTTTSGQQLFENLEFSLADTKQPPENTPAAYSPSCWPTPRCRTRPRPSSMRPPKRRRAPRPSSWRRSLPATAGSRRPSSRPPPRRPRPDSERVCPPAILKAAPVRHLPQMVRKIQPGTSALFILVRKVTPEKVLPHVAKYGGKILQSSASPEQEERLREAAAAA